MLTLVALLGHMLTVGKRHHQALVYFLQSTEPQPQVKLIVTTARHGYFLGCLGFISKTLNAWKYTCRFPQFTCQQNMKLQNPLYPLDEDEINPMSAMLAMAHGSFPEASSSVTVRLSTLPSRSFDYESELGNRICLQARQELPQRVSYSSSSYPTRNLTKYAFDVWNKAHAGPRKPIVLQNFCCTRSDCPQIEFVKIVLELLELEQQ